LGSTFKVVIDDETIPVLLHIDHTARKYAQKFYKPFLCQSMLHDIWIDPKIDTLYLKDQDVMIGLYGALFEHDYSTGGIECHDLRDLEYNLCHLALGDELIRKEIRAHPMSGHIPCMFPNIWKFNVLRTVTVVLIFSADIPEEKRVRFNKEFSSKRAHIRTPVLDHVDADEFDPLAVVSL